MSKISLVILLTVCHTILMMLVLTNLVPVCLSAGTCLYSSVERSTESDAFDSRTQHYDLKVTEKPVLKPRPCNPENSMLTKRLNMHLLQIQRRRVQMLSLTVIYH